MNIDDISKNDLDNRLYYVIRGIKKNGVQIVISLYTLYVVSLTGKLLLGIQA